MRVIGQEALLDDPRFATREARDQHEAEIDQMISDWTRRHDKHEAMRLVGAAGVPAGRCSTPATYWPSRALPSAASSRRCSIPNGELRMPAFPVRFDGAPAPVKPSPLLGEHTAQVFGDWLGMSAGDIEGLRDEGVV